MYRSSAPFALIAARKFHDAGLDVIPVICDGSKSPFVKFRDYLPDRFPWSQSAPFFANGAGIAILCGPTSGNLELLDFDDFDYFVAWSADFPEMLELLPVVATPDDGRHLWYRCEENESGRVLARNEQGDVAIETRGIGNYGIAPGSPIAVHRAAKPYRLLSGNLLNIPTIYPEQRAEMLAAARCLNRWERTRCAMSQGAGRSQRAANRAALYELFPNLPALPDDRPGTRFNQTADWQDILGPHGWKIVQVRGEVTFWRRPGATHWGWSATTNYAGSDLLFLFSTSVAGLEANSAHSKFAVYAALNHSCDYAAAARTLAQHF